MSRPAIRFRSLARRSRALCGRNTELARPWKWVTPHDVRRLGWVSHARVTAVVVLMVAGTLGPWAVPVASSGAAPTGDWSQFQFGPDHSGFNPDESQLGRTSVPGLTQAWEGTVENDQIAAPP